MRIKVYKGLIIWIDDVHGCVLNDFIYDSSWMYDGTQFTTLAEKDFESEPNLGSMIFEESYWMVLK